MLTANAQSMPFVGMTGREHGTDIWARVDPSAPFKGVSSPPRLDGAAAQGAELPVATASQAAPESDLHVVWAERMQSMLQPPQQVAWRVLKGITRIMAWQRGSLDAQEGQVKYKVQRGRRII